MHSSIYEKVRKPCNGGFPYKLRKNASVSYLALKTLRPSDFDYLMLEENAVAPERTMMMKSWAGYERGYEALFQSYQEARWFDLQQFPFWRSFHNGVFMEDELMYSELGKGTWVEYPDMTYLLDALPFLLDLKNGGGEPQFILGAAIDSGLWKSAEMTFSRNLLLAEVYGEPVFRDWCKAVLKMCRYAAEDSVIVPVYEIGMGGTATLKKLVSSRSLSNSDYALDLLAELTLSI